MRNKYRILLLAASILTIGCTQTPYNEGTPESRPINVEITARAGIGIESRTALGDDGISVRWSPGDRITLWALDAGGAASFEAQPFELRHYDATYDEARFTGTVPAMAQGSYTYCAVSPQPATYDGTRVTYPEVEKGKVEYRSFLTSDIEYVKDDEEEHQCKVKTPDNYIIFEAKYFDSWEEFEAFRALLG